MGLEQRMSSLCNDESRFLEVFCPEHVSPREQVLFFKKFRHAVKRSNDNYVKGVYFFQAFVTFVTQDVNHALYLLSRWLCAMPSLKSDFNPLTVFVFSRIFVGMMAHDYAICYLLSQSQISKQDICRVINNRNYVDVLWNHLYNWNCYIQETTEDPMVYLNLVYQSRAINTASRNFDFLHEKPQLKPFALTNRKDVILNYEAIVLFQWQRVTKCSIRYYFKKWLNRVYVTRTLKLYVDHWQLFRITPQTNNNIKMMALRWKERAAKRLLKRKKRTVAKYRKRFKKEKIDAYVVRFITKLKLHVLRRQIAKEQQIIHENKILICKLKIQKQRMETLQRRVVAKWRYHSINVRMHCFYWEKQAGCFIMEILMRALEAISKHLAEDVQEMIPDSISQWLVFRMMTLDLENIFFRFYKECFTFEEALKLMQTLAQHPVFVAYKQIEILFDYLCLYDVFDLLHSSITRMQKLFTQIAKLAPKGLSMHFLARTCRFHVGMFNPKFTRHYAHWISKTKLPTAIFGVISPFFLITGVELWHNTMLAFISMRKDKNKRQPESLHIFNILEQTWKYDITDSSKIQLTIRTSGNPEEDVRQE